MTGSDKKPFYQSKSIVMMILMVLVEIIQHIGWMPAFMDQTLIEGTVDHISGAISGETTVADTFQYLLGIAAAYFRATAKTAIENVKTSVKKAPSRLVTWFKNLFNK